MRKLLPYIAAATIGFTYSANSADKLDTPVKSSRTIPVELPKYVVTSQAPKEKKRDTSRQRLKDRLSNMAWTTRASLQPRYLRRNDRDLPRRVGIAISFPFGKPKKSFFYSNY